MCKNLQRMSLAKLRYKWAEAWGMQPHNRVGQVMLQKSLEYKIREQNGMGLNPDELARLDKLIRTYKQHPRNFQNKNTDLKDGVRLVRVWKGKRHIVTVIGVEFEYRGVKYGSLSRIANVITGKQWNGWVFFGLKKKEAL